VKAKKKKGAEGSGIGRKRFSQGFGNWVEATGMPESKGAKLESATRSKIPKKQSLDKNLQEGLATLGNVLGKIPKGRSEEISRGDAYERWSRK